MSRKEETRRSELNEDDLILLCGGRDIAKGREGEDEEKARQSRCSSHLPLNASRADAQIGGSGAVYIQSEVLRLLESTVFFSHNETTSVDLSAGFNTSRTARMSGPLR